MATEKLIVELDAKTQKLDKGLDKTNKKLRTVDSSVSKADKSFAKFTKVASTAAVAVTAVAAAITLAAKSAAVFAKELDVAANRSGETVERLQALAFATNTVGVSLEKLGDISKDTNEKIGEFITSGAGGFQDFADTMNLSAHEARMAAQEFSVLTGPEVLQEMVNQMEAAGISSDRMSFALEGLASDTTDLIPLLRNGGEELNNLTDQFDALEVTLSRADLAKIKDVGIAMDKLSTSFSSQSQQLIADYSREIIAVIDTTIWLGEKTADAFALITTSIGNLVALAQAAFNDLTEGTETFGEVLDERQRMTEEALERLNSGGRSKGVKKDEDDVLRITVTSGKKLSAWEKLNEKQKLKFKKEALNAASDLNTLLFNDNKAVAAGIIVAETAQNVVTSVKNSGGVPWGIPAGISAAAMGIAQLANLKSANKGGGSIAASASAGSSGSSGGASIPQIEPEETSDLSLSSRGSSNNDIVIRFATDSGDELLDVLAGGLNERQRRG